MPEDLLSCHDPSVVSKYMRCFALRSQESSWRKVSPSTIRSILSGLNRVLKEAKAPFSILDKPDHRFCELLLTLDAITSDLHCEGIGVTKKSAQVISFEHEELLCKRDALGWDTPKKLQRAVFFTVGLRFALRGVQEQHDLKLDQLKCYPLNKTVYSGDTYYEYTEFIFKNNQHRFKDINSVNKTVKCMHSPIQIDASFVCLIVTSPSCLKTLLDFTCAHWKECLMMIRSLGTVEA